MTQHIHITMPRGLGDVSWILQKMRSFRERYHPKDRLIAHIGHDGAYHTNARFLELTNLFDQVIEDQAGLKSLPPNHMAPRWSSVAGCRGFENFDYLFQANGHLETGQPIETWLPDLETDYQYDLNITPDTNNRVLLYCSGEGPNIGFRTNWHRAEWQTIIAYLNNIGIKPTIVGAGSDDLGYWHKMQARGDVENLLGKTDTKAYLELIAGAKCWFGLNSGGGVLSVMLKRPTIMLWSDTAYGGLLHSKMQKSWCGPRPDYHTFSYGAPDMVQLSLNKLLEVCSATGR